MSKIQNFSMETESIGKNYYQIRNPMDKIIFFGSEVFSVDKNGQLHPKFEHKLDIKEKKFLYFSDLNVQLAILFESQMQILSILVDLYIQLLQAFTKYNEDISFLKGRELYLNNLTSSPPANPRKLRLDDQFIFSKKIHFERNL